MSQKKFLIRSGVMLFASMFICSSALSAKSPFRKKPSGSIEIIKGADGQPYCHAQDLGVTFLCEPQWELRMIGKDIVVIISEKPAVTLTVSEFPSHYRFLEQLSHEELNRLQLYQEDFSIEPVMLEAKKALKIKALARENPDRRLTDYFIVADHRLLGFLFSVQPKQDWEEYQFMINRIVQSLQFIPK